MSILNNTKFKVKVNGEYIDITNDIKGSLKLDERIDMVLDSGSLFVNTNDDISWNLPPFSVLLLEKKTLVGMHFVSVKQYFYCSSNMFDNLTENKPNYHEIQVIEPTKMLEKLIVGTKAFSNIKGAYSYNTTYSQMQILVRLMRDKYGIDLTLDSALSFMNEEREYSFGAGTTLKDCLNEMMLPYKCIPRAVLNDTTLTITCDNLNDFDNQLTTNIEQWSFKEESQSVDDYCSQLEASYSTVVDRDTTNTVWLSVRSKDDIFSKDNGCLITPSNIEDVVELKLQYKGYNAYMLQIPDSCKSTTPDIVGTFDEETYKQKLLYAKQANEISEGYYNCVLSFLSTMYGVYGTTPDTRQVYVNSMLKDGYLYSVTYTLNGGPTVKSMMNLTSKVLNESKWNLLELTEQPKYLYFSNGGNYIDGFYNTQNDTLLKSMIYGSNGPFLKDFIANMDYFDTENFEALNRNYSYNTTTLNYGKGSIWHKWSGFDTDYTKYSYRLKYKAQSPLYAVADKTISPTNETAYKQTSRTYNNGANVVDFNQLSDAIQKSVDLLGLPITTIKSNEDYPVGTLTQFGYVISKQSEYCPYFNEFTYNCCNNVKQIAQAIGVKTQYEATNLPQTGIVDRFIYDTLTVSEAEFNGLKETPLYLIIQLERAENENEAPVIAKPMQVLVNGDVMYLVCQAQDNYSFDTRKVAGYNSYFKNEPVMYANANNYIDSYVNCYIGIFNSTDVDSLNNLPKATKNNFQIIKSAFESKRIYKDPRERLIFSIRVKK